MPHKVEDTVIFLSKYPLKAQGPRSTNLKSIYMYWYNKSIAVQGILKETCIIFSLSNMPCKFEDPATYSLANSLQGLEDLDQLIERALKCIFLIICTSLV